MSAQKPYYDDVQTRSRLLKLIEFSNQSGLLSGHELEQKCSALYSFYRSPAPLGYQYSWNHLWVMSTEFASLYKKMQKLLFEGIDAAKTDKTKDKRRVEALELAIEIWTKGYNVDPATGQIPLISVQELDNALEERKAKFAEQKELRKASIKATWRRGNTPSES